MGLNGEIIFLMIDLIMIMFFELEVLWILVFLFNCFFVCCICWSVVSLFIWNNLFYFFLFDLRIVFGRLKFVFIMYRFGVLFVLFLVVLFVWCNVLVLVILLIMGMNWFCLLFWFRFVFSFFNWFLWCV